MTCFIVVLALLWCPGTEPAVSPRMPVFPSVCLWLGEEVLTDGGWVDTLVNKVVIYTTCLGCRNLEYQGEEGFRKNDLGLPLHFTNEEIEAKGDCLIQGHHLLCLREN